MRLSVAASLVTICATYACSKPTSQQAASPQKPASESATAKSGGLALLPEKNELPISPDVFCAGLSQALPKMQQKLGAEAKYLCAGDKATDLLKDLLASPYTGNGTPQLRQLDGGDPISNANVRNFVAYSIRVPKKAVPTILAEEGVIKATSYANDDGFSISLAMDSVPPVNDGDCDTAFRVVQNAKSTNDRARFTDVSKHDLKLYRLYSGNFDYLAAGRTLIEPTEQVKYATIVRGFMPDPADKNYTITFSIVHSVMNGRGFNDRVSASFEGFVASDVAATYNYHVNP